MEDTNFRNVAFIVLLLVILAAVFTYIVVSNYTGTSIYTSLFYQEEE